MKLVEFQVEKKQHREQLFSVRLHHEINQKQHCPNVPTANQITFIVIELSRSVSGSDRDKAQLFGPITHPKRCNLAVNPNTQTT